MTCRILASLLLAIAGAEYHAWSSQSDTPQQTFTTSVELVRLDVSVLDKDRRPIRGLKAEQLSRFNPGEYLLTVEATAEKSSARREVRFRLDR